MLRQSATKTLPLTLRLTSLLVRTFLRAPKAADAYIMRLSTSASEVREWWTIEPRYLNSVVKYLFCSTRRLRTANSTPLVSISCHLAPFVELGWKVITLKNLFQSSAPIHLWASKKTPSTIKETLTSSRHDIWAKLRYGNVPSWVQKLTRKTQMSKQK
jgi:hypothetical protein